jgi:GT2 family glycosyltransferase
MASPENVGFCVANNRMVAHARGRFVLLLNNDAALYPDALKSLIDASARSDAVLTLPQFDWSSGSIVDRGCLLDLFYNPVPNLDCERTEVAMAIGACLFLSRDLWNSIGGFPEWFGSIGEDMYLCCLARLWGVPVKVVQKSGYRHRQGATFGGNRANDGGGLVSTYRRRALSERNKTLVMSICTPGPAAWAILCLHSILLGLEGVVLSILKGDRRIWKEIYYPACTYVPGKFGLVKAFRQKVQSKRRTRMRDYFAEFTIVPRKLVLLWRHGVPVVR